METINGELQAVVYIAREGKKQHVYDLSEEENTAVTSSKRLAKVDADDGSDAEQVLEARRLRAYSMMQSRADHAQTIELFEENEAPVAAEDKGAEADEEASSNASSDAENQLHEDNGSLAGPTSPEGRQEKAKQQRCREQQDSWWQAGSQGVHTKKWQC